ncbi:type I-E CRISPR-associated protein Cas6/Cse3/CasE [Streptomyces sp. NPDC090741]|uniref:type I-E CRISPR-associated protein Cas6/Cse3/CasE n=1 Tax=Streptomyces sp. NPDC090741 TaxID=3365967 RepID=UPI0038260C3B
MGRPPVTRTTAAARFVATHSVLTLDARHPFAAKSLVDAQEMHRTVMSGFRGWVADGEADARAQMGVLSTWSVDLKAAALVIVVQSRVPGDWSRIPQAAMTSRPRIITVDRTFRVGDVMEFRTVVNPVRSVPTEAPASEKVRGKRVAHTRPEHVKEWFVRRLQPEGEPRSGPKGTVRIGATADEGALAVRMLPTVSSAGSHKGLRIVRAELRGKLTVTDPQALADTLAEGIGHGRAYSCGLLLTR